MSTTNSLLLAFALAVLPLASGACADERNTEFCAVACECMGESEDEIAACTTQCADGITSAEESAGRTLVSDECFSCVTNSTCERFETECDLACESLQDDLNPPEPTPDPRPGDQ